MDASTGRNMDWSYPLLAPIGRSKAFTEEVSQVLNEIIPLKGVLALAAKSRYITDNPTEALEARKVVKEPPNPFTLDEATAIIEHIRQRHGTTYGAYFQLAFYTGMRNPSEIIALPWSLDFGLIFRRSCIFLS